MTLFFFTIQSLSYRKFLLLNVYIESILFQITNVWGSFIICNRSNHYQYDYPITFLSQKYRSFSGCLFNILNSTAIRHMNRFYSHSAISVNNMLKSKSVNKYEDKVKKISILLPCTDCLRLLFWYKINDLSIAQKLILWQHNDTLL